MLALAEAAEQSASIVIDLDAAYVRCIERIEARADNQSGSDKSWVERADHSFRSTIRRAIRMS